MNKCYDVINLTSKYLLFSEVPFNLFLEQPILLILSKLFIKPTMFIKTTLKILEKVKKIRKCNLYPFFLI